MHANSSSCTTYRFGNVTLALMVTITTDWLVWFQDIRTSGTGNLPVKRRDITETIIQNKKPLKSVRPDCRQFDLENRQTKVKVKVTIEINITCYRLPSDKVCNPFQCWDFASTWNFNHFASTETLTKMLTDRQTDIANLQTGIARAIRPTRGPTGIK